MNAPATLDPIQAAGEAINFAKKALTQAAMACERARMGDTASRLVALSNEAAGLIPDVWVQRFDAEKLERIRKTST